VSDLDLGHWPDEIDVDALVLSERYGWPIFGGAENGGAAGLGGVPAARPHDRLLAGVKAIGNVTGGVL
jgi:hypothetical protein